MGPSVGEEIPQSSFGYQQQQQGMMGMQTRANGGNQTTAVKVSYFVWGEGNLCTREGIQCIKEGAEEGAANCFFQRYLDCSLVRWAAVVPVLSSLLACFRRVGSDI